MKEITERNLMNLTLKNFKLFCMSEYINETEEGSGKTTFATHFKKDAIVKRISIKSL